MLSLKKVCTVGLAAALVATGLMATTAQAADTGNKADTSTATFSVKDDGALSLDEVPMFTFGEVTAKQMATGVKAQPLTNKDANQLQVTDTRGTGAGKWSLDAQLTKDFTSGETTLPDAVLNLATVVGSNSSGGYTQTDAPALKGGTNSASAPVIDSGAAFGGTSTYDYTDTSASGKTAAASLALPATNIFKAGNYTGTITWTLTAAD